jgi:prepilin-type processing-associated H-X9-DG protein
MMQTRTNVKWLFVLTIFLSLPAVAANEAARLDRILAPCMDDQTYAVAHLDVAKLDLDAFVDYVLSRVNKHAEPDADKQAQANLKKFRAEAGAELTALLEAGGRDVFVVFSMYDFPYFFVAVPIPSASDPARLHQYVQKMAGEFNVGDVDTHVTDRLILVGLKRTITRLKTVSPARSQALAEGLQTCANKTAQVVLFPSSDQRRILSEMLPQVPAESSKIQWAVLGGDLQWAALGLDGPPSISLNVTIQSASADGAERILTLVKGLYAWAGQYNEAKPLIPQLDQILKHLTPHRQGDRLRLELDSAAADSLIDDIVAPSLVKLRATVRRRTCGTNMSGIGKALLIYANDYDDTFPPDLETLIHKAEMPPRGLICPAAELRESYVYRGAGLTTSAIPMMITVYEKAGNHAGGRNVLFLDSHVEWVTEERFQELIKKDNEYRREKGLPVLPAQ